LPGRTQRRARIVRQLLRILLVAVVIVSAGAVVWAKDTPTMPNVKTGQAYERAMIWKGVESAVVPLPIAIGPISDSRGLGVKAGPVASEPKSMGMARGSAIPAIGGGGAILSPMQRTDLEIKKLIRRLG